MDIDSPQAIIAEAIYRNKNSIFDDFCDNNPNFDWSSIGGNFFLCEAIKKDNFHITRIFLSKQGIDPSYNDNEPIRLAVREKNPEIVLLLLSDPRVNSFIALEESSKITDDFHNARLTKKIIIEFIIHNPHHTNSIPANTFSIDLLSNLI